MSEQLTHVVFVDSERLSQIGYASFQKRRWYRSPELTITSILTPLTESDARMILTGIRLIDQDAEITMSRIMLEPVAV